MLLNFGISRATSDAAHEIRDGHLTREEGVAIGRHYDTQCPGKRLREFSDYCDIRENPFWYICERWHNSNLSVRHSNDWRLKYQVI